MKTISALLGATAVMALGAASVSPASAAAASATGPSIAALSCTMRVLTPTAASPSVYTLFEVSCNQSVGYIGGFVSLFRDGTYLGTVDDYRSSRSYAYKVNMVSCVPGNYRAEGYGFANINGGSPEFTQNIITPTVAITCA